MPEQLLSVREVAEILGTWKTSGERFPRRLIEERRITFVKIGRHVRIPASAVAELIAANTVQPITARRIATNRNAA
ncbi:excisionase family DNA-binding protein [Kitasatospora sp. NPDC005751]|uniref:excisionase family DNA-binding protein n=1 Tax=Kitasatospora sp. NPDC005751 TaxID=3157064 RepID=UPI0033E3DAC4